MTEAGHSDGDLVLSEEQALEIITFLVSSAEICLHEPIYYGTFRLIDGASRMIGYLLEHDPPRTAEFLRDFKAEIDANKTLMMWDRESYYAFLREIPAKAAAELKRLREAEASVAAGTVGGKG
jgi:hypothetical protein